MTRSKGSRPETKSGGKASAWAARGLRSQSKIAPAGEPAPDRL